MDVIASAYNDDHSGVGHMLTVNLAQRSYPVHIGSSIFLQKKLWQKLILGSQVCIITNDNIAPLYLKQLTDTLSNYQSSTVILPDGEIHKNVDSWLKILDVLVVDNHKRSTTLIALGGGVVGDITGFAAACYQRGVHFIQIPTTLLAQVDASIGGKTGLNYRNQKNLVGAFYQPTAVVIDTTFLSTLPEREFRSGLAEVIKYALIGDKNFFDYLSTHIEAILNRDTSVLNYMIEVCCRMKIQIITQDEFDQTGVRAVLNFGHTFGHALESLSHYTLLHGEAVAWGMLQACYLSQRLGYLSIQEVMQIEELLRRCDLFFQCPADITTEDLLNAMRKDKKNHHASITLILLKSFGEAIVVDNLHSQEIFQATVP